MLAPTYPSSGRKPDEALQESNVFPVDLEMKQGGWEHLTGLFYSHCSPPGLAQHMGSTWQPLTFQEALPQISSGKQAQEGLKDSLRFCTAQVFKPAHSSALPSGSLQQCFSLYTDMIKITAKKFRVISSRYAV